MNVVNLIGRLARDPQINNASTKVARYSLAVDREYKRDGQPTADFINCVCFGKTAEFVEKYLTKGMKIAVQGRIQTGSYTNRDGQRVNTVDVLVNSHEFVEKRNASQPVQNNTPQAVTMEEGFMSIPDGIEDTMPF